MEGMLDGEGIGPAAGVIPRAVEHIFTKLQAKEHDFTVKISVMELYNENLWDCLSPDSDEPVAKKKSLRIYDDHTLSRTAGGSSTVCVGGLEEITVRSLPEVLEHLRGAQRRRQTASTAINDHSSRSHMITIIQVHMKEISDTGEERWTAGRLNLVDLAGSENLGRSRAAKAQAAEAGMINQSLLTLGRVINALVDGHQHVPYRESKLTRLLRDALGGRAKTCIIATIAPKTSTVDETLSTLEYAHRAKNIKNQPQINERVTDLARTREMDAEILQLRARLKAQQDKDGGVYCPQQEWDTMHEQMKHLQADKETLSRKLAEAEKYVQLFEKLRSQLDEARGKVEMSTQQTVSAYEAFNTAVSEKTTQLSTRTSGLTGAIDDMLQTATTLCGDLSREQGSTAGIALSSIQNACNQINEGLDELAVAHKESVDDLGGHVAQFTEQGTQLRHDFNAWVDACNAQANELESEFAECANNVREHLATGWTTQGEFCGIVEDAMMGQCDREAAVEQSYFSAASTQQQALNGLGDEMQTLQGLMQQVQACMANVATHRQHAVESGTAANEVVKTSHHQRLETFATLKDKATAARTGCTTAANDLPTTLQPFTNIKDKWLKRKREMADTAQQRVATTVEAHSDTAEQVKATTESRVTAFKNKALQQQQQFRQLTNTAGSRVVQLKTALEHFHGSFRPKMDAAGPTVGAYAAVRDCTAGIDSLQEDIHAHVDGALSQATGLNEQVKACTIVQSESLEPDWMMSP
eukprot:NODE_151_length_2494_cov_87.172370_g147_i0.p1 GENE.NODE_151_length_2494_cov_87.172370_g147_i0~~NODE_151_length_2494_cov_87.172370_g147_i0.p1  ORF type:complete len:810 (+),score=209.91 NODE_151_length_2494_cov_87.172370_g147_i0:166-2430(+)